MKLSLGILLVGLTSAWNGVAGETNFSAFEPLVRSMSRRVLVYHFRGRNVDDHLPSSGYVDTLDPVLGPKIRERFIHDMEAFIDHEADSNGSQLGPAVYAANNPLTSKGFGGDNFSMYVVPLKKGARYFDLRRKSMSDLNDAQRKLLKNAGCEKKKIGDVVRSGSSDCREVIIAMVKSLDISFFIYDWDHEDTTPECTTVTTAAFALIRRTGVDWDRFRYLSRDSTPAGKPETAREDRVSVNTYLTNNWYPQAWKVEGQPVVTPGGPPMVDLTEWFHENLFTCGGKLEDMPWK